MVNGMRKDGWSHLLILRIFSHIIATQAVTDATTFALETGFWALLVREEH